ncbi:Nucleic acid-binding, OB-fold [Sesbania bispinosa]|nr:Nucleic acid-binding, OB-fold [Sesbania bispinosa]
MATISEIVDEKLWWYTGCTCFKAINFDRGYPFCTHCNQIVFHMSPRFKLKVLATDGHEATHFIMFDTECAQLLKKSCQQLFDEQEV